MRTSVGGVKLLASEFPRAVCENSDSKDYCTCPEGDRSVGDPLAASESFHEHAALIVQSQTRQGAGHVVLAKFDGEEHVPPHGCAEHDEHSDPLKCDSRLLCHFSSSRRQDG